MEFFIMSTPTQYVKLVAKPDTWFKAGTEVYDYDCNAPEDLRRITLAAWEQALKDGSLGPRGIRVIENPASEGGGQVGEERWDGEWWLTEEFDAEIVEESK